MKNALVKCLEEIERLAPELSNRQIDEKLGIFFRQVQNSNILKS
jgi:hypothetical protein